MVRRPPSESPVLAVLGGGQLGRMLGLAGVPLGVTFRFLDPSPEAGAAALGALTVGQLGDADAVVRVARGADALTYEWEGVPASVLAPVAALGVPVWPPPLALDVAQDRLSEKERFRALGIPVADFVPVGDLAALRRGVERVGIPSVLKTRRGGYDGKGQVMLTSGDDRELGEAWAALGPADLLLEACVPFERELSIVAVRSVDGDTRCWPAVENRHERGILRVSQPPDPPLAPETRADAAAIATRLLDDLGYVGVLTVELFQVGGALLANEIAPRVHNSGHWTIEGAVTSQFENHVRAVLGWPLGDTVALGASAMVNCIGVLPDPAAVLAVEGAHLHRYGKAPRAGRKVGHVTVTAADADGLAIRLAALRAVLPADDG